MPSFDVLSKVDPQVIENAINVAKKEIVNRYDFHGSKSDIDFNKKELTLLITTENEMRLNTIIDIIIARGSKQGIDPRSYDVSKEHYASGPMIKKDVKLKNGLDKETMKKIAKAIKDSGLDAKGVDRDKVGVIWASGIGGLDVFIEEITNLALNETPRFNPFFINKISGVEVLYLAGKLCFILLGVKSSNSGGTANSFEQAAPEFGNCIAYRR